MSYELKTSIGTFVIYNRNEDTNPEIGILGDQWTGTGAGTSVGKMVISSAWDTNQQKRHRMPWTVTSGR